MPVYKSVPYDFGDFLQDKKESEMFLRHKLAGLPSFY